MYAMDFNVYKSVTEMQLLILDLTLISVNAVLNFGANVN